MKYISTRDTKPVSEKNYVTSAQAIKQGLAPDGGLFMPTEIPALTVGDMERLKAMPYNKRAAYVLSMFSDDYSREFLEDDCALSYSEEKFPGGCAPVVSLPGGIYSLELWHGPTCAFKDMALQIMPRLLSRSLDITGETRTVQILVATSGDTGKAALEGYKDIDKIKILVFYPEDGVSEVQKLQMATQLGDNVNVCAIKGNFDDAQNGVKKIFADTDTNKKLGEKNTFLSSANSINWGRLAPQIVYYISAYCDLLVSGKITDGEKVNVCVPTGNFGNIFAAYIAKQMGLPIKKFICASNTNNILTDFLETGRYDRNRQFHKTMSPSMDILISSNLERLLFMTAGSERTSEYMKNLNEHAFYQTDSDIMEVIKSQFHGEWCSEEETAAVIRNTMNNSSYLCDTHTAVGLGCAEKYREKTGDCDTKIILASTASPFKFASDVYSALTGARAKDDVSALSLLAETTNQKIPQQIADTLALPVRFKKSISSDEMTNAVLES